MSRSRLFRVTACILCYVHVILSQNVDLASEDVTKFAENEERLVDDRVEDVNESISARESLIPPIYVLNLDRSRERYILFSS